MDSTTHEFLGAFDFEKKRTSKRVGNAADVIQVWVEASVSVMCIRQENDETFASTYTSCF